MSGSPVQSKDDLAQCSVCFETYNRTNRAPVSVNCGHTFCHSCVHRTATYIKFTCPVCRYQIFERRFEKSFLLIQALERLNLLANDDDSSALPPLPVSTVSDNVMMNLAVERMRYHRNSYPPSLTSERNGSLQSPSFNTIPPLNYFHAVETTHHDTRPRRPDALWSPEDSRTNPSLPDFPLSRHRIETLLPPLAFQQPPIRIPVPDAIAPEQPPPMPFAENRSPVLHIGRRSQNRAISQHREPIGSEELNRSSTSLANEEVLLTDQVMPSELADNPESTVRRNS